MKKLYSKPIKALVMLIFFIGTIIMGYYGSWISVGLRCDMTLEEMFSHSRYERSQAAASYLERETHTFLQKTLAGENLQKSNAYIFIRDISNNKVYTNEKSWKKLKLSQVEDAYNQKYSDPLYASLYVNSGFDGLYDVTSEGYNESLSLYVIDDIDAAVTDMLKPGEKYEIFVGMNTGYTVTRSMAYTQSKNFDYFNNKSPVKDINIIAAFIAGLLISGIAFILMCLQTGHVKDDKDIHPGILEKIPLEIMIIVDFLLFLMCGSILAYSFSSSSRYYINYVADMLQFSKNITYMTLAIMLCAIYIPFVFNHYLRRLKLKSPCATLTGPLLKKIKNGAVDIWNSRKYGQKVKILYILMIAMQMLAMLIIVAFAMDNYNFAAFVVFVILILVDIVMFGRISKEFKGQDQIRQGIDIISKGDLDYKISLDDMSENNAIIAEGINNIGVGLKNAVASEMKSERLRTDLITNVSHDIKTPLTSIINYVDILKKEDIQDEKIAGYIDVLDRKAARLKQLTDDLVEASKISSGNIVLELNNINLKQLIKQAGGEFEEKFQEKQLNVILNLPDEEMIINVDGNRMYRVLDNLFNNTYKYSMPGTRVYINGEISGDIVVFSMKNISENPLNISADELVERFVRGDVSRTTEGTGLGLEIAKNLTVLMGGKFNLYLDGDLFKVTIEFLSNQ